MPAAHWGLAFSFVIIVAFSFSVLLAFSFLVLFAVSFIAQKQRMRTQISNERLAFNGKLGPGALGPGPMAHNTGKSIF